jgi:quercetin dioxygenase-like cupin family protein
LRRIVGARLVSPVASTSWDYDDKERRLNIRRFDSDVKSKILGGHPGLYGVPIALPRQRLDAIPDQEAFAARVHGLPFALNTPVTVEAMYFEPHARMDEHSAPNDILFLVTSGSGKLRLGGARGETREVAPGDAVIWPAGVDHAVWTEEQTLTAIVINLLDDLGTDQDGSDG